MAATHDAPDRKTIETSYTTRDSEQQPHDPLWDPKHAVVGVIAIALSIFVLDVLPHLIASRIDKLTHPDHALPQKPHQF